jgi:hypothetical protein
MSVVMCAVRKVTLNYFQYTKSIIKSKQTNYPNVCISLEYKS